MIIISPGELRGNLKKYLDLAENENIVIQRGKSEIFELRKRKHVEDTRDDIVRNIRKGFEEMKLIKKGKLKTTPAKDFLNEL